MADPFEGRTSGLESPVANSVVITPNDGADLAIVPRGISVNVSGIVKYDGLESGTGVEVYLVAGMIHPIRPKKIYATTTGSTATGIVGHW